MIGPRRNQPKISADGAHRLVKSLNRSAAPHQAARREALLHARGERQILFDFAMALLELNVHFAQRIFSTLLRGNIRERDEGKDLSVRIFNLTRGDHYRQPASIAARHVEFKKVVAFPLAALDLPLQLLRASGGIPTGDLDR